MRCKSLASDLRYALPAGLAGVLHLRPLARDVRTQNSALPERPVQPERNVVGIDSVPPLGHKRPERILTDDAMKLVEPMFLRTSALLT
jgi:hypothetical protein